MSDLAKRILSWVKKEELSLSYDYLNDQDKTMRENKREERKNKLIKKLDTENIDQLTRQNLKKLLREL